MAEQPHHIAYIMDGNGRWGLQHHHSRLAGHLAGVDALKRVVKRGVELKIPCLSFFAFSTENWSRPGDEVNFLLQLLTDTIHDTKLQAWVQEHQVRIIWNGFRNISPAIREAIEQFTAKTSQNTGTTIQVMFNYGSQQMLTEAVQELVAENQPITQETITLKLNPYCLPKLDLLVRTGGEIRVSNFMLWELAYAELLFRPVYWPDYDATWLDKDLAEFQQRHRRFGGLDGQAPHQSKWTK